MGRRRGVIRGAAKGRTRVAGLLALVALLAWAIAGCATDQATPGRIPPTVTPALLSARMTPAIVAAASPTPTPRPASLTVWWPAPLAIEAESGAGGILARQIAAYEAAQGITVNVRTKKPDGPGGIHETLFGASQVAVGAMPDLALVPYGEMTLLVQDRLAQPFTASLLPVTDIMNAAQALGIVQGTLYGVPFALEVQHAAYRAAALPNPPHTSEELLESGQRYVFPGKAVRGVSPTFLAMYVAEGGRLSDEDGAPILDGAPLLRALQFIEQGVEGGQFDASALDYADALQYWSQFMGGRADMVQVDSTTYLAQRAGGMPSSGPSAVGASPVPMPGDAPPVMVEGWVFAITATEPGRRDQALDFVAWLMDSANQGALTEALGVLPSRRAALQTWDDADYAAFVGELLAGRAVPPVEIVDPDIAAAMTTAFEAVLTGRATAENAAQAALAGVGG
ncbi:MAG: extracellular solute-binding protein [Anaerolineae bacterium]|nr:extracellular solute-binding protein [Anaerolineae bacterium]